MSFSVGIVGLPNVGKSTLFKALTKKEVDIASYPFTTIEPNIGIVTVPDKRLKKIAEIIKPEKITPTIIKFIDIAGLVKGAHKGDGLGNQFLAHIRECDAILEIVRTFSVSEEAGSSKNEGSESEEVQYQLSESPNPKRDTEIIKTEFIMKDLETTKKTLEKLEKQKKLGDKELIKKADILKKVEQGLSQEKKVSELGLNEEEISDIKEFQFLTLKPSVYVFNIAKEQKPEVPPTIPSYLTLDLKLEKEISELSESDIKELELAAQLDSLIIACYNILDLITFYTIAGLKETRAWTLKKEKKCPEAGGIVHSDFEENFIKAEVISWQKLIETGSWGKAKETGLVRTEGKNYIVQDGDVIEFKI